jgi:hypothetical protein
MKLANLLPLLLLAACTDQATKQETVQIFATASTALGSAQSKAVDQARGLNLTAPAQLSLDFSGPCLLGGTVALKGDYVGSGDDERAEFDLTATFNSCRELGGTLDGSLAWTSDASAEGFAAALKGELDWTGKDASASCDFDMALTVAETGVAYGGHLCGYDVKAELVLGN